MSFVTYEELLSLLEFLFFHCAVVTSFSTRPCVLSLGSNEIMSLVKVYCAIRCSGLLVLIEYYIIRN